MARIRVAIITSLIISSMAQVLYAQQKRTTEAFDAYLASAEARVSQARGKSATFLRLDSLPTAQRNDTVARLRQGEVVIEKQGETPTEVPGGLIHDWVGTVFIPKV